MRFNLDLRNAETALDECNENAEVIDGDDRAKDDDDTQWNVRTQCPEGDKTVEESGRNHEYRSEQRWTSDCREVCIHFQK